MHLTETARLLTPHDLRHTGVSRMIKAKVNVMTISKLVGHKNVATTYNVYGHLFKEDRRTAIESLQEAYSF